MRIVETPFDAEVKLQLIHKYGNSLNESPMMNCRAIILWQSKSGLPFHNYIEKAP